jgi:hypothetical protein
VPARIVAPGLGAVSACAEEGVSPYLQPGDLTASISFRYLHSFREFHGDEDLPFPSPRPLLADTHVYGFLLGVAYQATPRFSFSLEIPIQYGTRGTYYEHDFINFSEFHTMKASGVGDIKFTGSTWLLDPDRHHQGNISLGLGVKVPTGRDDAMDISYRPTGPVLRPVDPAIQPGNGGWGIAFDVDAFQKLYKRTYAYLQGTYISEPRDINDVEFPTGDIPIPGLGKFGELFRYAPVPDSYLGRAGVGYLLWPKYNLALTVGARIEGVPPDDILGSNDHGIRNTGYSVYFEPGLIASKGKWSLSVSGPVAVYRYVGTDVVFDRVIQHFHIPQSQVGFAALADYLITASVSFQF